MAIFGINSLDFWEGIPICPPLMEEEVRRENHGLDVAKKL